MAIRKTFEPAGAFFTQINIDRSSAKSFQLQLYEQIRDGISSGLLPPGSQVPSSRSLAGEVGCSRNTVLAVLAQLTAEDFLTGVRGSGVYVVDEPPADTSAPIATLPREDLAVAPNLHLSTRGAALQAARVAHRGNRHVAFSPSMPDVSLFPIEKWSQLHAQEWRRNSAQLLREVDARGFEPLRSSIAHYVFASRGVACDPDQVIVTSGAQQGIDLIARLLVDPGNRAWVEDPGYSAVRELFSAAGAQVVPVSMDGEGIAISQMSSAPPHIIAVSPSHQFPAGITMSARRRIELLKFAQRSNAWIVEDDYDSEFRYEGQAIAALASLGSMAKERVIYVGTFSKMLFPAIRLGFLVVPATIARRFARARATLDLQPSIFAQPALARFIREGHLATHVRRMRPIYRRRQQTLITLLEREAASLLSASHDAAGLHVVARFSAELASRYDDVTVKNMLMAHGLTSEPMSAFYAQPRTDHSLVLGFACTDETALTQAVAKLVAVLRA